MPSPEGKAGRGVGRRGEWPTKAWPRMGRYKKNPSLRSITSSSTTTATTTMRSIILLAAALCCQAAPQAVVPLVYTSASTPTGVTPASGSFLSVVQGPKPVVLSTVSSFLSQPSPVLLHSALPSVSASVPFPAVPALPLGLSATQYRLQDELGNMAFSHAGGPNARSEVRTAFGAQVGRFSYIDGEGTVQHRSYVSDALGTRMAGTDLPVSPEETPEVAKARAALTDMQASSGGRSRRSVSTLPILRLANPPITHSVNAATFALPLGTYATFPAVAQVDAPGISSIMAAPATAPTTPAAEDTKPTLKVIDTLNPHPTEADLTTEKPAPSPVLVKSAAIPTQPMVAAPISSPAVALATKPGPSTVVVKSTPAQSVAAVGIAAQPALAVAASPVSTRVLVKATQPGPSTVVVKSAPAQPVAAAADAAQPAAPAVLVKAAPAAAVAVSSPAVAVSIPMPTPMEAPNPPAPSPEVPFKGGKFHSQDELGQFTFGHFGGSHTRVETKNVLGHTRGSFAYLTPEGEVHVRKYAAASGLGFTVAGSDLPVDNSKPVQETREVAQARRAHLALKQAEKETKAVV